MEAVQHGAKVHGALCHPKMILLAYGVLLFLTMPLPFDGFLHVASARHPQMYCCGEGSLALMWRQHGASSDGPSVCSNQFVPRASKWFGWNDAVCFVSENSQSLVNEVRHG